jgi:hypothetical protein
MEAQVMTQSSVEATLHIWRTAAEAVTSDPLPERRQAYEAAIAEISEQLVAYTSLHALMVQSWSIELAAIAATAGLAHGGRVLNYQVVAGAACWQRLSEIMQAVSVG